MVEDLILYFLNELPIGPSGKLIVHHFFFLDVWETPVLVPSLLFREGAFSRRGKRLGDG